MARYRVSRRAVRDLDEIWYFIAKDNESAASRLMERFYSAFTALATQPRMGRARPEIGTGMRSFAIGEQIIFYQLADYGVRIVRVWDGRQDTARIADL
jgi:toxin ParE1/3/4